MVTGMRRGEDVTATIAATGIDPRLVVPAGQNRDFGCRVEGDPQWHPRVLKENPLAGEFFRDKSGQAYNGSIQTGVPVA
jgi:hypothetical protein